MKEQKRIHVVLADDSAVVREKLSGLVAEQPGVDVVALTGNAVETIEAIRLHHPNAVILDLRMPQGGGLRVLKDFPKSAWRPVMIVLTNYSSSPFRESCMVAGADYFLDKSTEFDKIIPLLTQCFGPDAIPAESAPGQHNVNS